MKDILVTAEIKTPSGHAIRTSYSVPLGADLAYRVGNRLTHAAGYSMVTLRRMLEGEHGNDLLVEAPDA